MAKAERLIDPFHTTIGADWGVTGVGETWVSDGAAGGHVELSVDTVVRSIYTATAWDLTGSAVWAKVTFPEDGNGTRQNSFEVSDTQTGTTNRARFFRKSVNVLQLALISGGTQVTAVDLTYSATDHLYLRFAELAGVLFWDTSPDGRSWTNRHSITAPSWGTSLAAIYPRARAFRSGAEDPSVVTFDNVNYSGSTVHPSPVRRLLPTLVR